MAIGDLNPKRLNTGGTKAADGDVGRPPRIAHLQHPYIPGLGYQENYLPAAQHNHGATVLTLTSDEVPKKFEDIVNEEVTTGVYEYNGVKTRRLESWFEVDLLGDVALRGVTEALDEFDPDLIHAHGLLSPRTLQAMRYAERNDVALFVDVHIDNDNFNVDSLAKQTGFEAFRHVVLPRLIDRSEAFLPVNPLSVSFLENLGVPAEKIRLLPLGVDMTTFSPDPDRRAEVRADLGVGDDFLFVTAGNLEPTKDIEVLIDALNRIIDAHANTTLFIVGDGEIEYTDSLRTRVASAGLGSHVRFIKAVPREKLAALYNAADVGVWPGKLGMAIIEAIGTGLPIIVCDSPATSFLTKRDNGRSFPRGDDEALADRVIDYAEQPKQRARDGLAAATYAREELAWSEIGADSIEIYREALE